MKRSQINHLIRDAESFFRKNQFYLPEWAHWEPVRWGAARGESEEIFRNQLGWDLTDFGGGDFEKTGLLLFTIRNGNPEFDEKPYAEKIMIVKEGQVTPMHFHWRKMEDIINRGGGNLIIKLYQSDADENLSGENVRVAIDGQVRVLPAGSEVVLVPGQSICLTRGLYHRFWGEPGKGRVLVGEVSMVNDDTADNRFLDPVGRFPEIEEDEPPYHLLASDYKRVFQ